MSQMELRSPGSITDTTQAEPDERDTPKVSWRHCCLGLIAFLYFSGMNMSLFTVIQYIYRRIQIVEYPNKTFDVGSSYCTKNLSDIYRQVRVQETASEYMLLFSLVSGIPAIFVNILLGSSTDSYGRKFLMVTAMTGTLLRILVCMLGVYMNMELHLFAIAFVLEGMCGQPFTFLLSSYSYACDVTTRKRRALGIVLVEVCVGLGTSVPTFAVGYLVQQRGFKEPFIISAAFLVIAIVLAVFILPESFPKEKRSKKVNKCMNLKNAVGFYVSKTNSGKRWKYIVTILAFFLTMNCLLGRNNVEILYQMNAPFCWSPKKLGWFGALKTGLQQVIGMVSAGLMKQFLADDTIAMIGCLSYAACFIIEAVAKTDALIYIVTVVGSLGLLTIPMTRSILSRMTSADQQGALAASVSSVETTCNMFSVVLMNVIYKATVNSFGGAVFVVMATLNGITLTLLVILRVGSRGEKDEEEIRATYNVRPVSYFEKPAQHL